MAVEIKRMSAVKSNLGALNNGTFVKQDGFNPSYMLTRNGQRLSRIRVMGTIIDKFVSQDRRYAFSTLDDGTGTIRLKAFSSITPIENAEKGDMVDIIGKVRVYNEEVYIAPEVLYKVNDPNFMLLRRAELLKEADNLRKRKQIILESRKKTSDFDELKKFVKKKYGISPEEVESVIMAEDMPKTSEEKIVEKDDHKEKVIKLIETMDTGSGCEYSFLIKESGLAESVIEGIINELLSDGICFEPRPGVIKLL